MAEEDTEQPKAASKDDESFLADMRKRYDRARDREDTNITEAYIDLSFRSGDGQWDEAAKREREEEGRPCLQVNIVPQFVRQVTGDIRQMKPAIKVIGVDDQSDTETAEKLTGLIRYIENRSDAPDAYFRGADSQVTSGVGHWRVTTEYASESTFEQELRVAPIEDGVSVLWDPDSILPTREDAGYCFVPVDMSRDKFEELYPGKTANEMDDTDWTWATEWTSEDHVRIAEYWCKKPVKRDLAVLADGSVQDITDLEDTEKALFLADPSVEIKKRDGFKVERYLVTQSDILEGPYEWVGRFIPIVPVWGEEIRIGRRLVRHGMVRFMRDPQRMYNYLSSADTEVTALQPKAPFLVTEDNVASSLDFWDNANQKPFPYLPYKPDPGNSGIPPQRSQPPVSSRGIATGLQRAEEDLHRVTGVYPSALGQQGNETSGKAILARQREGDVGTFVYIDNFTRAIRHTGRILIDAIPKVYDTERTIRILGEDGQQSELTINKPILTGQGTVIENDVTIGAYDVVAEAGPSYTTRREEAKQGMMDLLQTLGPDIGQLMLDKIAKAQDWPMADDIAERARMLLPPRILEMEAAKEQGIDPAQMPPPQEPPDPRAEAEAMKMQAEAEATNLDNQRKAVELQMKQDELQFKRAEYGLELQIKQASLAEKLRPSPQAQTQPSGTTQEQ